MTDVMKLAQDKRARLMKEIETRMGEVEKLDQFMMYGTKLATEMGLGDDDHDDKTEAEFGDEFDSDDQPSVHAAE